MPTSHASEDTIYDPTHDRAMQSFPASFYEDLEREALLSVTKSGVPPLNQLDARGQLSHLEKVMLVLDGPRAVPAHPPLTEAQLAQLENEVLNEFSHGDDDIDLDAEMALLFMPAGPPQSVDLEEKILSEFERSGTLLTAEEAELQSEIKKLLGPDLTPAEIERKRKTLAVELSLNDVLALLET